MAQHQTGRGEEGRPNLYEQITTRIIAELEAGRLPWIQPWGTARAALGMPYNVVSGRRYSGINILTLWHAVVERGFQSQAFLTFRQAVALGGSVRRGEHGVPIVYARRFVPQDERRRAAVEGREMSGGIPFLRHFTVFSADQCDGLPDDIAMPLPPVPEGLIAPEAEALIKATGADFRIGGAIAFYSPAHDYIAVPRPDDFHEPVNWHRTAFHELGHWSGHKSRLDRDLTGSFGSKQYGREELVAEMTGAFVCASLGITPTVRHADYIGSWLDIIREDARAIVRAASAASRAADFLLAFRPEVAAHNAANDDGDDPDDPAGMALGRGRSRNAEPTMRMNAAMAGEAA
ncbi:ArdC family protein [Sphingomonas lycopersici]|uniref:Zincin-like metallopeptidase domain-containing protein n=1 Tax=Sphingomonas lycopersici TaxID=2951807 RepID=A0AA41ZCR7_9SPHN|nr:zincin-like metallopeptidase domain-containing protein [Sphingomonas lycopersici]MCW6536761.1 zincin-like metallopeptidase domain-containing protein [Sphingomonas lycopersici]